MEVRNLGWGANFCRMLPSRRWCSDLAMQKVGGLSPFVSSKMLTEALQITDITFAS
jgi:hypothetical protein